MLSGLSGLSGLSAVCGGAAAAFSPTQLSGYVNSPYNIALLRSQGKMWQDTAMTVAATADGDPVRRIDCDGTYYDAPSDAARPLLYSEGGGKWSLSFDGVDDTLAIPSVGDASPAAAVGYRLNATITGGSGVIPPLTDPLGGVEILITKALGGAYRDVSFLFGGAGTSSGFDAAASYTGATWNRLCVSYAGGGVSTPTNYAASLNGAEQTISAGGLFAFGAVGYFGSRGGVAGVTYFNGRTVGFVLSAATSAADRASLDTYLAALAPTAPPFPTTLTGYVNSPYNIALLRSQGKLWQDTAMTVPATADGDPVRRIDCGGTYYDAPSDAARPLLYSEGSGKWSLSFDGVDDQLKTPAVGAMVASQPITVYTVFGFNSAPAKDRGVFDGNLVGEFTGISSDTQSQAVRLYAGYGVGSVAQSVGTQYQWRYVYNGASSSIRRSGISATVGNGGAQGLSGMSLGNTGSASYAAPIRVQSFVIITALVSAGDDALMTTYLQTATGIAP